MSLEPVNPYAAPRAESSDGEAPAPEQPLSLLAALNIGTSLYFRLFPTVAAITIVVWLPAELIVCYLEYYVVDPNDVWGAFRNAMLAQGLVGIIAVGGTISVGAAAMRGERRDWLAGLADGLRGWPRIFSSRFVGGLVLIVAGLLFVLPGIYLAVRFSLSDSVAILERRAGSGALGRSLALTRGRFLIFLALCTITIVPVILAGGALFLPLAFFPQYDHWLLAVFLSCLLDLLEPWMTLVFVAAYFQRRAEKARAQPLAPAFDAEP